MMLQDFFDKEYSRFVTKGRFQSAYRFFIRTLGNIMLPMYFKVTRTKKLSVTKRVKQDGLVVTLTSFPDRIPKLWLVIECILKQSILPEMICIWLSKKQFVNGIDDLPSSLRYYETIGLIHIYFVDEDFRSHKKYFYAFEKFPNFQIITLDDDIFYSSCVIKNLLDLSETYPNCICSLRGYEVLHDDNGGLKQYKKWRVVYGQFGPAFNFFHTSGGGTLYRRDFFTSEVLNSDTFLKYCLLADDVWLNVMAQLNNTKTVKHNYYTNLLPVLGNEGLKLSNENVGSGGNDKQLRDLLKYYKLLDNEIFV